MVELPQKKVGIVACSGEELAEGTVTRLAALKVLEQLRPKDTVTICLPMAARSAVRQRPPNCIPANRRPASWSPIFCANETLGQRVA